MSLASSNALGIDANGHIWIGGVGQVAEFDRKSITSIAATTGTGSADIVTERFGQKKRPEGVSPRPLFSASSL